MWDRLTVSMIGYAVKHTDHRILMYWNSRRHGISVDQCIVLHCMPFHIKKLEGEEKSLQAKMRRSDRDLFRLKIFSYLGVVILKCTLHVSFDNVAVSTLCTISCVLINFDERKDFKLFLAPFQVHIPLATSHTVHCVTQGTTVQILLQIQPMQNVSLVTTHL